MVSDKRESRRAARRKASAEVFTPPKLVNEMLDKLPKEVWEENKTFCDPACGNGEFLIWILLRKIRNGHSPLVALQSIYGVDIMRDNVAETCVRLLKVASFFEPITREHCKAVYKNIVCANSLEYDFSFDKEASSKTIKGFLWHINENHVFDKVEVQF